MGLCGYAFGNIFETLTLGRLHHQYVRILFPAGTVTSTRVTRAAESMSQSAPIANAVAYAVGSPKDTFTADIIPPVIAGPRICGSTIEMR